MFFSLVSIHHDCLTSYILLARSVISLAFFINYCFCTFNTYTLLAVSIALNKLREMKKIPFTETSGVVLTSYYLARKLPIGHFLSANQSTGWKGLKRKYFRSLKVTFDVLVYFYSKTMYLIYVSIKIGLRDVWNKVKEEALNRSKPRSFLKVVFEINFWS